MTPYRCFVLKKVILKLPVTSHRREVGREKNIKNFATVEGKKFSLQDVLNIFFSLTDCFTFEIIRIKILIICWCDDVPEWVMNSKLVLIIDFH